MPKISQNDEVPCQAKVRLSFGAGKCGIHEGVELPLRCSTIRTYKGSRGFPNTVMYESFTKYLTSIYGFGGRYRLKENVRCFVRSCTYSESVFKMFIRLKYCFIFSIRVQYECHEKTVHHHRNLAI